MLRRLRWAAHRYPGPVKSCLRSSLPSSSPPHPYSCRAAALPGPTTTAARQETEWLCLSNHGHGQHRAYSGTAAAAAAAARVKEGSKADRGRRSKHSGDAGLEQMSDPYADFGAPHDWYTQARKLKRSLILHVGPTNAGKTHEALERLQTAASGIYCGPLRLLAWEVYEKLNMNGVPCELWTGQEVKEVEGSRHVSCTVEMADITRVYDVAVVDECQLLGDKEVRENCLCWLPFLPLSPSPAASYKHAGASPTLYSRSPRPSPPPSLLTERLGLDAGHLRVTRRRAAFVRFARFYRNCA